MFEGTRERNRDDAEAGRRSCNHSAAAAEDMPPLADQEVDGSHTQTVAVDTAHWDNAVAVDHRRTGPEAGNQLLGGHSDSAVVGRTPCDRNPVVVDIHWWPDGEM